MAAIGTMGTVAPAFAATIELADGYLIIPDELLFLLFVGAVAALILICSASFSSGSHQSVQYFTPDYTQHYDVQAEEARALKRKLDADTALAESILRNARTNGELDEIGEILDHEQVKRLFQNDGGEQPR